jgi:hypothetical protein
MHGLGKGGVVAGVADTQCESVDAERGWRGLALLCALVQSYRRLGVCVFYNVIFTPKKPPPLTNAPKPETPLNGGSKASSQSLRPAPGHLPTEQVPSASAALPAIGSSNRAPARWWSNRRCALPQLSRGQQRRRWSWWTLC